MPPSDRLALLYRVSQTFNSSLDLDQVLNAVMDEVIASTRAERGFLMLRDAGGGLVFRAARGIDHRTIDAPEFQISRGLVERVAHAGQPLLTSDAQSDARLNLRQSVLVLGLRSILCVPLKIKEAVSGVVYVDNRLQAGIFTNDDLELLSAIASSAAIAIENARLYQVAVEKGRLERELQMAREVQASLLPRATPALPGWEFAARWEPAREVAGDYYDFIAGPEALGLVIADVSDKGMPAALFMALTRSIIRASAAHTHTPAEGIARANRLISADATNSMFVTLFYARLNPATGELAYVNAGHNPPWRYHRASDELTRLTRTGMALGVDETLPYACHTTTLEPGDMVLLYTDGVTDAVNASLEEFGEAGLESVVREHRRASASDLVRALEQAVYAHMGATQPLDDITLVAARRL